jgi:precorrin-6B methylase 2
MDEHPCAGSTTQEGAGLHYPDGNTDAARRPDVTQTAPTGQTPNRQTALALYQQRAHVYDIELLPLEPLRQQAVARLGLQVGDTVLDVGCGTGLSFDLLEQAIGPEGLIIGIEQSPEMLTRARARMQRHQWHNVTLLESSADRAPIPCQAQAALLHFTHDILCQSDALKNIVAHLSPGSRIVATGLKWAAPWLWPVNLFVAPAALYSVTCLENLSDPWRPLSPFVTQLDVQPTLLTGGYIACGVVRDPERPCGNP